MREKEKKETWAPKSWLSEKYSGEKTFDFMLNGEELNIRFDLCMPPIDLVYEKINKDLDFE